MQSQEIAHLSNAQTGKHLRFNSSSSFVFSVGYGTVQAGVGLQATNFQPITSPKSLNPFSHHSKLKTFSLTSPSTQNLN